jgi:hypothetical protein
VFSHYFCKCFHVSFLPLLLGSHVYVYWITSYVFWVLFVFLQCFCCYFNRLIRTRSSGLLLFSPDIPKLLLSPLSTFISVVILFNPKISKILKIIFITLMRLPIYLCIYSLIAYFPLVLYFILS